MFLGVVLWIGGVAFVTTTLIPSLRKMSDSDKRSALFEQLEGPPDFEPDHRIWNRGRCAWLTYIVTRKIHTMEAAAGWTENSRSLEFGVAG